MKSRAPAHFHKLCIVNWTLDIFMAFCVRDGMATRANMKMPLTLSYTAYMAEFRFAVDVAIIVILLMMSNVPTAEELLYDFDADGMVSRNNSKLIYTKASARVDGKLFIAVANSAESWIFFPFEHWTWSADVNSCKWTDDNQHMLFRLLLLSFQRSTANERSLMASVGII